VREPQDPAEKAIAQIESSLAEIRPDAEKYAPEDLKGLDESVLRSREGSATSGTAKC
jgi:hypothetical protein